MRRVALITLVAFGCATVRVPVAPLGEPADAAGSIAPPLTELWLESPDPVGEPERAHAEQQAREALAFAMQGRAIAASALGASDAVLFVRERAVGVTDARRSQQNWAKVGIVVGVVLVVAVIVIAVVAGRGKGVSKASGPAAPAPVRATPVPIRRVLPLPVPRGGPRFAGPVYVGFYFDFWIPPRPLILAPVEDAAYFPPEPPAPLASASDEPPPALEISTEPPPPPPDLTLPPLDSPADFNVRERGFFDGPRTAVQLDLVDRASGRLLWSKAVAGDANPLDAREVAALIDEALGGQAWAHR